MFLICFLKHEKGTATAWWLYITCFSSSYFWICWILLREARKQSSSHDRYGGRIATKLQWQARKLARQHRFVSIEKMFTYFEFWIYYNFSMQYSKTWFWLFGSSIRQMETVFIMIPDIRFASRTFPEDSRPPRETQRRTACQIHCVSLENPFRRACSRQKSFCRAHCVVDDVCVAVCWCAGLRRSMIQK